MKPGLGIIGLGGYDADPARLVRARAFFEQRGMSVTSAPDALARNLRFAGSDEQRLAALTQFVADPTIGMVMALRGGYGMSRLLADIDFHAVAHAIVARDLRIVGHSDFTAFHLALLATTGAISYAGPMASYDFGGHGPEHQISAYTLEHFDAVMNQSTHAVRFAAAGPECAVDGTLWGGNLAMVCSLIGTPWMPQIEGGVLFLEDIGEQPYRIERMLLQLLHTGILARQRAVLLGHFTDQSPTRYDNGFCLDSVVDYLRERTSVPVITGLPFGHIADKLTLPVGGHVSVCMSADECLLEFYRSPV